MQAIREVGPRVGRDVSFSRDIEKVHVLEGSYYLVGDDLINQGTSLINQFNAIDIGKYSQLMSQLNQSVSAAKSSETNAKTSETNAAASARELANLGLYVDSDGYIVQDVEE